ncbi:ArgE/DapE family deacylase [Limosilactobacillus sp.]|uniref:ArgE/DapE family deacylase n=1 Tax=Limosilactobacillus sp. TaxID=2773925 RepID=UPI003F094D78
MQASEQVQVLQDLIKIRSTNGNEVAVARYLQQLLAAHGIDSQVDEFGDRRANLTAKVGQGTDNRVLGLTGHMDTVAVTDPDSWQHDPFGAEIVDDRVYGRGAADMKSGLAAQVLALIELKEAGQLPTGTVKLIATAGEELGTPGAFRLAKQGAADDLAALVVGEPTGGNVIFAHSGSLNYEVTSIGKAAHSSAPERGINAISGLVKFIEAENKLFSDAPVDPYLGHVQHSVTVIKGGHQVNTIPASAKLQGNIRPTAACDNQEVARRLHHAIDLINHQSSYHLELNIFMDYHPISTDPQSSFVQAALTAAQENFPHPVKTDIINGATDASVFTVDHPDLPVIVLGSDAWQLAHQTDEYTTIPSFLATVKTYQQIVTNFFN